MCIVVFAGVAAAVTAFVSACFHLICRSLYGTPAKHTFAKNTFVKHTFVKHDYQMGEMRREPVWKALVKREFKRYFSSGTYMTNTIIGPVMGTVFAGAVLVVGLDRVAAYLPAEVDPGVYIPFLAAGIFCMMNTTCVSISLEGRNWWILNSLPLDAKAILDAKILMNLLLVLPFYLVSEVMLCLSLRLGPMEQIWLLLIPAVLILFSAVFGLTVNLHFPVFTWESEVSVVKQSASSMLGGLGGVLLTVLFVVANMAAPGEDSHLVKAMCCIAAVLAAGFLYRKNNRMNLQEL